jgi:hypothetical protein
LSKLKKRRLPDMVDASFVWLSEVGSSAFYDPLMREYFRGGLKTPRIVRDAMKRLFLAWCHMGWVWGCQRTCMLAVSRERDQDSPEIPEHLRNSGPKTR